MKYTIFPIKLVLLSIFLLSINSAQAQFKKENEGKRIQEKRDVSNFDKIAISHGLDAHLYQAEKFKVIVNAEPDFMDKVITEVKKNTLIIKMKDNDKRLRRTTPIDIEIHLPNITNIAASGGSDVYGKNSWKIKNLDINISGGSDIEIKDLTANKIECNSSGGSDIELSGSADKFHVHCSGGSDVETKKLKTKTCKINASGGSDVEVFVTEELTANASGASDIEYKGNPRKVKANSTGASDIDGSK